jgi:hypothetical protein
MGVFKSSIDRRNIIDEDKIVHIPALIISFFKW